MEISAINNNIGGSTVVRQVLSSYSAGGLSKNDAESRPAIATEKHQPKEVRPLSENDLNELANKINQLANNENLSLQFTVDASSGKQIMQFVDQSTKKVVQQFPSEEMIHLAAQIDHFLEKNQKLFPSGSILSERI